MLGIPPNKIKYRQGFFKFERRTFTFLTTTALLFLSACSINLAKKDNKTSSPISNLPRNLTDSINYYNSKEGHYHYPLYAFTRTDNNTETLSANFPETLTEDSIPQNGGLVLSGLIQGEKTINVIASQQNRTQEDYNRAIILTNTSSSSVAINIVSWVTRTNDDAPYTDLNSTNSKSTQIINLGDNKAENELPMELSGPGSTIAYLSMLGKCDTDIPREIILQPNESFVKEYTHKPGLELMTYATFTIDGMGSPNPNIQARIGYVKDYEDPKILLYTTNVVNPTNDPAKHTPHPENTQMGRFNGLSEGRKEIRLDTIDLGKFEVIKLADTEGRLANPKLVALPETYNLFPKDHNSNNEVHPGGYNVKRNIKLTTVVNTSESTKRLTLYYVPKVGNADSSSVSYLLRQPFKIQYNVIDSNGKHLETVDKYLLLKVPASILNGNNEIPEIALLPLLTIDVPPNYTIEETNVEWNLAANNIGGFEIIIGSTEVNE